MERSRIVLQNLRTDHHVEAVGRQRPALFRRHHDVDGRRCRDVETHVLVASRHPVLVRFLATPDVENLPRLIPQHPPQICPEVHHGEPLKVPRTE